MNQSRLISMNSIHGGAVWYLQGQTMHASPTDYVALKRACTIITDASVAYTKDAWPQPGSTKEVWEMINRRWRWFAFRKHGNGFEITLPFLLRRVTFTFRSRARWWSWENRWKEDGWVDFGLASPNAHRWWSTTINFQKVTARQLMVGN